MSIDDQMKLAHRYLSHDLMWADRSLRARPTPLVGCSEGIEPIRRIDYYKQELGDTSGKQRYYLDEILEFRVGHVVVHPAEPEESFEQLLRDTPFISIKPIQFQVEPDEANQMMFCKILDNLTRYWDEAHVVKIPPGKRIPHMQRGGFKHPDKRRRRF